MILETHPNAIYDSISHVHHCKCGDNDIMYRLVGSNTMIIDYINTLVLLVSQLEAESKGGVRDTDWQPQSCQHTDVPTPHTHTSWIRNTHHWTLNQKNQFYSSKIGIRYCTLLLNVEINKCQHNMIRVWIATSTDLNSSWWVTYQIIYTSKQLTW